MCDVGGRRAVCVRVSLCAVMTMDLENRPTTAVGFPVTVFVRD